MKRKLTKKQAFIATLSFLFNAVIMIAISFAMLAIKQGNNTISYLSDNLGKAT